jgi:hypothetical protein
MPMTGRCSQTCTSGRRPSSPRERRAVKGSICLFGYDANVRICRVPVVPMSVRSYFNVHNEVELPHAAREKVSPAPDMYVHLRAIHPDLPHMG